MPEDSTEDKDIGLQEQINLLKEQMGDMQEQIYGLCQDQNVTTQAKPVSSIWLYKDGDSKVFHGKDIDKAKSGGWKDAPTKKKGPKPK